MILEGFPAEISFTIPSVRIMATSISLFLKALFMAPVPSGNSTHSRSIPSYLKSPSSIHKCHGKLKCSGTPPTFIFFIAYVFPGDNHISPFVILLIFLWGFFLHRYWTLPDPVFLPFHYHLIVFQVYP